MSVWLKGLNPEQKEAAKCLHGPLLIIAGAGSGKTRVIISRTGYLLESGVDPSQLVILTFTNKAALELKQRLSVNIPRSVTRKIFAGTFHSFGLQFLRDYGHYVGIKKDFGIISSNESYALIREVLSDIKSAAKKSFSPEILLENISHWRATKQTEPKKDDEYEIMTSLVLPRYLERIEELSVFDFDSLILKPFEMISDHEEIQKSLHEKFQYFMIDEFQDTNPIQMKLLNRLVNSHHHIAVVGDDDQSIYGWRGADVKNILNFPKQYHNCRVVTLTRNYRCSQKVLALGSAIISCNKTRYDKTLVSASPIVGKKPMMTILKNEDEELDFIVNQVKTERSEGRSLQEMAVLYRSNTQGAALEAVLRSENIPYQITGGYAFFERKEIRDAMSYLKSVFCPNDISLRRVMNTPQRGIGIKTIEQLEGICSENKISMSDLIKKSHLYPVDNKVSAILRSLNDAFGELRVSLIQSVGSFNREFLSFLEKIGYRKYLDKISSHELQAAKRWKGVERFSDIVQKFLNRGEGSPLKNMYECLSLLELRDFADDEDEAKLSLMTLHAAKGLEFESVIIMGVEEDTIPHKTLGKDISEERRLLYVGVTRAKKKILMTRILNRKKQGKVVPVVMSRFLEEVSKDLFDVQEGPQKASAEERSAILEKFYQDLGQSSGFDFEENL